ncbi:glycosyltransferase [Thermonema rossianum]|uniref:glycosyltransferase n=1 Tax=Thermonema rossianum TaxID=55505 RepID=UPI00068DB200|nr:glycosyltransferase [Thermonema rossianum]
MHWTFFFMYALVILLGIRILWHLLSLLLWRHAPRPAEGHDLPGVSVVVAAHNELLNLRELLPLLLEQDYPLFEVIIVDDRSWDDSYEFLYHLRARHPQLHIVRIEQTPEHITHKKFAITMGVKAARYDIVLLTDADCRPLSKQWIRYMAAPFIAKEQTQIVLGASLYEQRPGFLNALIRYETLYTLWQYATAALIGLPYMGVGRNLAYRRSFFLKHRGFGPHQRLVSGDDDLFVNRLATAKNTALCVHAKAITVSRPKVRWREWWRQKRRHLSVGKYYKAGHRLLLALLFLSQLAFYVALGWVAGHIQGIVSFGILQWIAAEVALLLVLHPLCMFLLAKKLRASIPILLLPFLELSYLLYIGIIGLWALLTKVEKWN